MFFILLLLFCLTVTAQDVTVYVAPTGSGLICTEASPCQGIKQAIAAAKTLPPPTNGGTVVVELATGTYNLALADMGIDIGLNCTIAGPTNARPVFNLPAPHIALNARNYFIQVAAHTDVSIDNIQVNGAGSDVLVTKPATVTISNNGGKLSLHNVDISGSNELYSYPLYGVVVGDTWPDCVEGQCTNTPIVTSSETTLNNVLMVRTAGGVFLSAGLQSVLQTITIDTCTFQSMSYYGDSDATPISMFGIAVYGGFPLTLTMSSSIVELNQYPLMEPTQPDGIIRINSLDHCDPDCESNKNPRLFTLSSVHFRQNSASPILLALRGPIGLKASDIFFKDNAAHDSTPAMVLFESISDSIWTVGTFNGNDYPVNVLVSGKWVSQTADIAGLLSVNNMAFNDNKGLCIQSLSNCFLLEISDSHFDSCARGAILLQGDQCKYPMTTQHVMKFASSTFTNNGDADQYGGGIASRGGFGSINLADVTFTGNKALLGAAIYASSSASGKIGGVRLSHTTFTGNTARTSPFLVAAEDIPIFISDRSSATDNVGCTGTHDVDCPALSCSELTFNSPNRDAGQLLQCENFAATHGGYIAAIVIICLAGVGVTAFTLFKYFRDYSGPSMITQAPNFDDNEGMFSGASSETAKLVGDL